MITYLFTASARRVLWPLLACAVPLLIFAGCGSSSSSSTSSTGPAGSTGSVEVSSEAADPAVVALVPDAVKSQGSLSIATDPTYAPNEFYDSDNKTIIGMDVDLAQALTAVMGLKAEMAPSSFDSLIPGLSAGKYDIGMASFTDTKEREEVVDFVTYFSAGTAFFTLADGSADVSALSDLCGHSVAVQKGTSTEVAADEQDAECRKGGEEAVDVQVYPGQDGANLALSSGRAELGMADSPIANYQVEQSNGKFKVIGEVIEAAPYGIAIPKESGLSKPILAALKVLMKDGTYEEILAKWGEESGAITSPAINDAIS